MTGPTVSLGPVPGPSDTVPPAECAGLTEPVIKGPGSGKRNDHSGISKDSRLDGLLETRPVGPAWPKE